MGAKSFSISYLPNRRWKNSLGCTVGRYETVWLTQKLMAELFQKDVRTISEHIKNVYLEKELTPEATVRTFRIVQKGCIQNIRTSEKRFYQKITDIYATSMDTSS
jgi:hypothetical protein